LYSWSSAKPPPPIPAALSACATSVFAASGGVKNDVVSLSRFTAMSVRMQRGEVFGGFPSILKFGDDCGFFDHWSEVRTPADDFRGPSHFIR
jgi:hypothetical protein